MFLDKEFQTLVPVELRRTMTPPLWESLMQTWSIPPEWEVQAGICRQATHVSYTLYISTIVQLIRA